jgi:hypothetical protein
VIATTAAIAINPMFFPEFLPQKDAALFCVVRLNKCKKVHNKKAYKSLRNLRKQALQTTGKWTLQHNLS